MRTGDTLKRSESVVITNGPERKITGGDIVEKVPQPIVKPTLPDLNVLVNKLSVKYNAKTMLEQESGEALSNYINAVNATIREKDAKIKELEEELKKAKEVKA
jgi:vacuolar-type H+-ATPase subunit I/STV1